MQTKDLKYINLKRTIEANKIQRLQSELHMIDVADKVKNTHTFFVDSDEDIDKLDIAARLDTHPALLSHRTNRPKLSDLSKIEMPTIDPRNIAQLQNERKASYRELKKRIEREKELTIVQQKMLLKRTLQEKRQLKPKRIRPATKDAAPIYEFKYERKR